MTLTELVKVELSTFKLKRNDNNTYKQLLPYTTQEINKKHNNKQKAYTILIE